jgi:hypothetical protein
MLDGFDEIGPFYNETVIDLLQGLRMKVVEQMWVTIRPHPRERNWKIIYNICPTN